MTDLIPREILFGNPVKTRPKISPDGKRIAYIAPSDNILNIWVKTIGFDDDRAVTKEEKRGIDWSYVWAYDNKHILYEQDSYGDENLNIYSINLETGEVKNLTPYRDVQARFFSIDKHFPDEILIIMNKDNLERHDIYKLNLTSGLLELAAKNPGKVPSFASCWLRDASFTVRAAMDSRDDGGYDLFVRKDKDSEWKRIVTWTADDGMISGQNYLIGFSKDGNYIFLMDPKNANSFRLVKMEIVTGKIEVIVEDPHYDVMGALVHPDTREIQAVFFEKARREWLILDETIKQDFQAIKALDRGDPRIVNRSNDDNIWIISFTEDAGSVSYYAYYRKSKKFTFLFYDQPSLKDYTLAEMEPVSFVSRDGLTIHGYITFPPGKERKNLPLILRVHGGPWWRDSWGYNPEVQLFANRGYACLQVNFRGSTGYGKDFINAADKEWAGKVQNDLIDGIKWAIERGIADPKKIAIYGRSYGGYAALLGATLTPDIFCCSVDVYGITNFTTFIQSMPPYWSSDRAMFIKRIGDPETEEEFLKSSSPLFMVDRIKIPILIAQGGNDVHVKQSESEEIVEAMKNKGIDYEYILFPDEGHGFMKPENRMKFYTIVEKFLAKHLGGRFEN